MSIENQATFWLRNVNDYNGGYSDLSGLSDGYRAFSELMKRIYEDYRSYEISTVDKIKTKIGILADGLENYHNLMETIDCIYQLAMVGVLREEGDVRYLEIEKGIFKTSFKGSTAFPFLMLETYGFCFKFLKNGNDTPAYKGCDRFYVFYENDAKLIPAMKYLAESIPELNAKYDYISKQNLLFSIADYQSLLLKNSTKQNDLHPLKSSIVTTAGSRSALWHEIVEKFLNEMKLTARAYINPYVFPNWTVIFLSKNKTVLTFTITPDVIRVVLFLSYDAAKEAIDESENLPKLIHDSIKRFGCIGCGKCTNQSCLEIYKNINLCKKATFALGGGEGRRIDGEITSPEEVAAIYHLTKMMQ